MKKLYPVKTVRSIPKNTLTPHERLILILLLDMQACEQIYISAALLATESGLSEATVKRIFGSFKQKGIMSMEKRRFGQSYRYVKKLNIDTIESMSESDDSAAAADTFAKTMLNEASRRDAMLSAPLGL
ncbi:MAG: hypothetical protein NTV34_10665 [Proteobacteria bacterium]|nr:hypothetical protein [Pseudomonadota bacterium]